MGTAALFNRMLHEQLNTYAAWFPVANTFKLGDYGLISDGVFTPLGNIAEFGVEYTAENGPPASLDFTSDQTRIVRLVGDAEVNALPDAPIEARLVIEFGQQESFLAKAAEISTAQMQNVSQVARSLAHTRGWERKYRVVSATYIGQECAIVTTRAANARFELSGKANALKLFELGKVEAGLSVATEQNIGFKSMGKTGVIGLRLFKLGLWGDDPKLLGQEVQVDVETDGPAELEDDV